MARGTEYHQEIRPGAGFKTGHFAEERWGGVTVERLETSEEHHEKKTVAGANRISMHTGV